MRESGLFLCHTGYMDEIAGQACNEGLLKISFSDMRYFVCFCRLKNSKEKGCNITTISIKFVYLCSAIIKCKTI